MSFKVGQRRESLTIFIAAEGSPTPREAKAGKPIPDEVGNVAIGGFTSVPGVKSENRLDEANNLLLDEATLIIYQGRRRDNGEFDAHTFILGGTISGVYTGPGSALKITR